VTTCTFVALVVTVVLVGATLIALADQHFSRRAEESERNHDYDREQE
jgi:hypothetical protein